MCTKTKQLTLFRASSLTDTLHICQISVLILFSHICLHVISIAVLYTEHLTPYTICACLNILQAAVNITGNIEVN